MQDLPRPAAEAEDELRRFFELSPIMLCIAGFDGHFKRINPAWQATLGHTTAELLAAPYIEFVHPDDRARTLEEGARLRAGNETISFENRYRCSNTSYKWLLWRAHADFQTNRIYAAARDITEQKQAEDALRATATELARSNEELAQFAHIASHDLQEPLRMVASFLQLIEKRYTDALDDEGKKFIGFAVDGAKRMQLLIQDLLSLSRVQTRGRSPERTDCAKVFRGVMTDLQIAVAEAEATVTCDALPTVMADSVQIAQVLQNMLANALKFRRSEPVRIHVAATRGEAEWQFSVTDNGIGIDSEFFDRIFGIFQRLRTGNDLPGTGMGLAVCKKIIERHGGRIWVESEPGRGSTFFFTIPDNKGPVFG